MYHPRSLFPGITFLPFHLMRNVTLQVSGRIASQLKLVFGERDDYSGFWLATISSVDPCSDEGVK